MDDSFDYFVEYHIDLQNNVYHIDDIKIFLEQSIEERKIYSKIKHFEERILNPMKEKYPQTNLCYELNRKLGLGYFKGICFHISAKNKDSISFGLVDGGASNWIEQILSDRHEQCITSSLGVELLQNQFKAEMN